MQKENNNATLDSAKWFKRHCIATIQCIINLKKGKSLIGIVCIEKSSLGLIEAVQ